MEDIKKTGPRDVFLQLLAIITLYMFAINFGVLLFQYVNVYLPDPLTEVYYTISSYQERIRWALSSVVVVFPVYVWVNWFIEKELNKFPEKRKLRTRKWLLHLTLFLAAIVIIGDLVSLVYNFLQGELTLRFVLKVSAILVIAASVFGYYLWILKRDVHSNLERSIKIFSRLTIVAVAIITAAGFFIAGTPGSERQRRFDERRVSDLQNIQSQIVFYWQNKNRLPENLSQVGINLADPQSGAAYQYRIINNLEFELCANFNTNSSLQSAARPYAPNEFPQPKVGFLDDWTHGAGEICFKRVIDPDLYKQR